MRVIGKTDIGKNRAENQDNFRSGSRSGFASWGVVCDGMGGAENGKLASYIAVNTIESQFYDHLHQEYPEESIRELMKNAIDIANIEVFERSGRGEHVMGTTVVAAVVKRGRLHIAHAGDSRAYLYSNRVLHQITKDHSIVQELVDQGALAPEAANRHPEKNVITRALGVDYEVESTYFEIDIAPDDIVMLCTDGLTNVVGGKRIAELLSEYDVYSAPSELVQEALRNGGNDNITVLLMQAEKSDMG